ncbi:hypothetical protein Leryth_006035 [Lithospermum erythrorhizon]|nr:hypothetical protein Leryth_006035 [Lithospermum erythrorhizon]
MSTRIAAELLPSFEMEKEVIMVRKYQEIKDQFDVEELEKKCEVVQKGKPSIVTDLLGDPIGRVRYLPLHAMLVAEYRKEIVGVIRGSIRTVSRGKNESNDEFQKYVKVAYIGGLRVSPSHRRFGIATKLVEQLEEWFIRNGAEYAYMATDCSNQASINLFTQKCNYVKFRTPRVLVQPISAHYKHIPSGISIIQIPPQLAITYYTQIFKNSEFYPLDIDLILNHKLNLGTFMALPNKFIPNWDPRTGKLPNCYAILSIWNTKEVYKLQVKGLSAWKQAFCLGERLLDTLMPCLKVHSIPTVLESFGFHQLFGLHVEGKNSKNLMKGLCNFAHNLARNDSDCGLLITEVSQTDPVCELIPYCKKYSWDEDLWCMKKLEVNSKKGSDDKCLDDWTKPQVSSSVIFVDPRDF